MKFSSKTMNLNIKNAVAFLTFKKLEEFDFIKHAFSTRLGGVSTGVLSTMNFSSKSKDKKENIKENLHRFCNATGISKNSICFLKQEHGTKIKIVNKENYAKLENYDGSVTNISGLTLATFHADCCPIFLVDPVNKIIGLAHAGWRGTIKNIAKEIVEKAQSLGSHTKNLICCLGPSIGQCCFEVQDDVANKFKKISDKTVIIFKNKLYADIIETNKINLMRSGILKKNIFVSDLCTKCCSDLLYSYRNQGQNHGNMMATISVI